MAVPTIVLGGTAVSTASAVTLTPGLPTGRVNGYVMIAYVSVKATGKTFATVTGGWTKIAASEINSGNQSSCAFWRLVDGTEAAPVITWTGNAAGLSQIHMFSGNAASPIGNVVTATGNSATTATSSGVTSTADNSLTYVLVFVSTSQTLAISTGWTTIGTIANANTSVMAMQGALSISGRTSEAVSVAIASSNYNVLTFEILGSGSGAGLEDIRVTQNSLEVLEIYTPANNNPVRVSQVTQQVLEAYTPANNNPVRVSQVSLQILRTVSTAAAATGRSRGRIIG